MAFGDLVMGWRLLVGAEVALGALEGADDDDKAFYRARSRPPAGSPRTSSADHRHPRIVADLGNDLMELDEAAF